MNETNNAVDEFEDADLVSADDTVADEFAGYEAAGKLGDIDDRTERQIIPKDTEVILGIAGFQLYDRKKGSESICVSLEVIEPAEFAGDATNFKQQMWLKTARGEGKDKSAWEVTRVQIGRMAAAVYNKTTKDPAVVDFLDPVFLALADITDRSAKKVAFQKNLVALLNDELAGKSFTTKIGVVEPRDYNGKHYGARQSIGNPQYPGCYVKKADS